MLCQYNPSILFMAGKIDNLFRSDLSVKEISFLYKHIIKGHVVQQNPLLPVILIGLQFLKDFFRKFNSGTFENTKNSQILFQTNNCVYYFRVSLCRLFRIHNKV